MLRAAVERKFEVIGEAITKLVRLDETIGNRISDYKRIIAFRNVLIHGYADVDDRLVWDVVETNLPCTSKRDRSSVEGRVTAQRKL